MIEIQAKYAKECVHSRHRNSSTARTVVLRKLRSGTKIPGLASTYPVTPKIRWMNFT